MKLITAAAAAAIATSIMAAEPAEQSFIVRTLKPSRTSIAETISQTGSLEAPATVQILPKVSGRLVSTSLPDGTDITEGTKVKKGEKIAQIESSDYAMKVAAAKAVLSSATASLEDAQKEFDRTAALLKVNTATEQEADKTLANLERAKAAKSEAEANLALAQISLDETSILAPFDGVVSKKHAYVGAMLSPATPIYTVTEVADLKLLFDVPTTIFARLEPGVTEVSVTVDAYPTEKLNLKLHSVHPVASAITRTVRIELHIANPDGKYLPGMYAKGEIALNRRDNALVLPFTAVVPQLEKSIVYKVVDGRAVATEVKLGTRYDAVIEVLEGVSENDEIVSVGQHRLTDGVAVSIETLDAK